MIPFCVYNNTNGNIIRSGYCDSDSLSIQVNNEEEAIYQGLVDPNSQTIDLISGEPVNRSEEEQSAYNYSILDSEVFPKISSTMTDTEIDTEIDSFYYGHVDVDAWKLENYSFLREIFYPDLEEKADAEVKINSGIEAFVNEGESQLQQYIEDCLSVKIRFPKE